MGSLILCTSRPAKRPYPVPVLGISLYTAEELCYYIYHYLFLLEEDFINESLLEFIRTELNLPALAEKIRKWADDKADMGQILYMMQQDIHYCNDAELADFKKNLDWFKSAGPSGRAMRRADLLLELKRYMAAVRVYDTILSGGYGDVAGTELAGRVLHNKGTALAALFEWRKAMECFVQAYRCFPSEGILKEVYQLSLLDELLVIDEEIQSKMTASQKYKWKEEFDALSLKARDTGKALEAAAAMEKDPVRRREALSDMLDRWKREYREMVK